MKNRAHFEKPQVAQREKEPMRDGPAREPDPFAGLRGLQPLVGNRALLALFRDQDSAAANTPTQASPLGRHIEETAAAGGDRELRINGIPVLRYPAGEPAESSISAAWSNRDPNRIHLGIPQSIAALVKLHMPALQLLASRGLTIEAHAGVLPKQPGPLIRIEAREAAAETEPAAESESNRALAEAAGDPGPPPPPDIVEPPPDSGAPQRKCSCGGTCPKCAGSHLSGPNHPAELEADRVAAQMMSRLHTYQRRKLAPLPDSSSGRATDFGSGTPLPVSLRNHFENGLGRRLHRVRIHTGPRAEQASERIGARAFAYGSSVVFNRSEYAPESAQGRSLLAHELTHVVQQQERGHAPRVQRQPKPQETAAPKVLGITVYCSDDPLWPSYIVLSTTEKAYTYRLKNCTVPPGSYDTEVKVTGSKVDWTFPGPVLKSQDYNFNFDIEKGQQNPATLLAGQKTVHIDVKQEKLIALPKAPDEAEEKAPLADRVAKFKRLVKTAGIIRMEANRKALADWRTFLEKKLTPAQVERGSYAQEVRDLQVEAVKQGGLALGAYDETVTSANPIRRFKAAGQVRGRFHACTGCHLENMAQQFEKEHPELIGGRDWIPPVTVLKQYATQEQVNPTPRPDFFRNLPDEGLPKKFEINDPRYPGASQASAALAQIQPFLQILGPSYYDVLPGDLLVNHPTAEDALKEIVTRIEARRSAYENFSKKIAEPDFDYLTLRPIVRELLPLQDDDVQQAIEDEIKVAEAWETVKKVVMFGVTIALILLAIFPPTSAIGIAGVAALETGMGAYAIYEGLQAIDQGYTLSLARGASDVVDPEQVEAAGMMMVMGVLSVAMGALGIKGGAAKGIKLLRGGRAAATAGAGAGAKLIDGLEAEAGGNKFVISDISSGNPKLKVTSPDGKVLYDGLLKDMPQSGFGTGETAPVAKPDASMFARQRAAAAIEAATSKEAQALELESRASKVKSASKAAEFRTKAEVLRKEAAALRDEASQISSGAKSATADLPTPDEIEAEIDRIASGGGQPQQKVEVPLSKAERSAADVPRLERGLLRTSRGRVVFRVEGSGSRTLLNVGPGGAITTSPGTTYLNFGSLERALEFLAKRGAGARIVAFEVEESWVQSVRSAAIPEKGTSFMSGQTPKLVDVRFAEDQFEIPANLLPEMEKFIVPGSAKVILTQ
jgi:hypothetical protein